MTICRYFQQGTCNYGSRCRFEHVSEDTSYGGRNDHRQGHGGYSAPRRDEHYGRSGRAEDYQSRGNNNNRYTALAYEQEEYRSDHYSGRGGGSRGQQSYSNYDESTQNRRDHDAYSYRAPVSSNQRFPNQFERADSRNRPDNRGMQHNQNRHQGVDSQSEVKEILSYISEDMAMWEESKMWLFSCYAFQREVCSLPGLDDLSMEEARLEAYEAKASGKTSDYLSWMSTLKKDYAMKRQQLMSPNSSTRASLVQLINDALRQGSTETAAGQRFTSDSVSTTFSNHSNVDFGGSQTQPLSFGSGPATGFISGAAGSRGGQFGSDWNTGSGGQNFSNAASAPPFGNVAAAPPFGNAAFPSAFTNSAPAAATGFTNSIQPVSASAAGFANQSVPVSKGQPSTVSQVHTPIELLSPEEKTQFEAVRFTLGSVPLRPPPQLLV